MSLRGDSFLSAMSVYASFVDRAARDAQRLQATKTGKRGGKFVVTKSGAKVYVK